MNSSSASPAAWYSHAVDRRLRPRRSLFSIALAGGRAQWHAGLRWAIGGLLAMAALLMATERHRVCDAWGRCDADDWGAAHTLVADHGAVLFVMLAFIVTLQAAGYRRRLAGAVGSAIGAAVITAGLLLKTSLTHFLSRTEGGGGAEAMLLLVLLLCLLQVLVEPVLAAGQRKRIERDEPVFPRAAVVAR